MRCLILILFILFSTIVSAQTKVTVILFDNNVADGKKMIPDTLLNKKVIDLLKNPIDPFFICGQFHLPYYLPTNGFYKNEDKDKECDMKIYPQYVKCYEYDSTKKVIRMTVNGSGTMNDFVYKYNAKNQILSIIDHGFDKFVYLYNSDGTISDLYNTDNILVKRLKFIYE